MQRSECEVSKMKGAQCEDQRSDNAHLVGAIFVMRKEATFKVAERSYEVRYKQKGKRERNKI
jgi:hypothetical protein